MTEVVRREQLRHQPSLKGQYTNEYKVSGMFKDNSMSNA